MTLFIETDVETSWKKFYQLKFCSGKKETLVARVVNKWESKAQKKERKKCRTKRREVKLLVGYWFFQFIRRFVVSYFGEEEEEEEKGEAEEQPDC